MEDTIMREPNETNAKEENNFSLAEKIEDMMIYFDENIKISLKDILELIKNVKEQCIKSIPNSNLELNIDEINEIFFSFSIKQKAGTSLLRTPIKVNMSNNEIDIVCVEQLEHYLRKYFTKPKLYCSCQKILEVSIRNLKFHENHKFFIEECEYQENPSNESLELEINKYKKIFIKKTFLSPNEFEKNFEHYFKMEEEKKLTGPFYIFDDDKEHRQFIAKEFIENKDFGKKRCYFGVSGKGKSITLIGALKYSYSHDKIGTLYINCKTLKNLLDKQEYKLIKKILTDEILFLFYNNYYNYIECYKKIMQFNYFGCKSFWSIINIILDECSKIDKKFIIGFDQYNNNIDEKKYLNNFEDRYLNNNNKFKFIVISSMNETDVRKQKMDYLFEKNNEENIFEIDYLCQNFNTNFNPDELDAFTKLGKTFKAYNEIQLKENKTEIKNYINIKKRKYLFKLFLFYKEDKNEKFNPNLSEEMIMNNSSVYEQLLSFQLDYKYSYSEITEVIRNIPFKYFNVKEYKQNKYIVEPGFPLIREIMEDFYKYLIVKRNFGPIKRLANKKGSAFATIFELKIRYDFYSPIRGSVRYFKNFVIEGSVTMEVIIPKKNEKKQTIGFIQQLELDKAYLVEQKQFGGKHLDFLIIHMTKEPKVFGFQVSIYKQKIFKNLSETYNILSKRLYSAFNVKVKEENIYFGYIFDYSRKEEQKYKSMINNCHKNNMKYSFYDFDKNVLYNDKGNETHDIYDIVGVPKLQKKDKTIEQHFQNIFLHSFNPFNKLSGGQKATILDLLKLEKKDESISSLKFINQEKKIMMNENYVSIVPNFENNSLMIFYIVDECLESKIIDSNKNVQDNTIYFSDKFDIYEIIKK